MLSRNFCQKCMRVNIRNYHTVVLSLRIYVKIDFANWYNEKPSILSLWGFNLEVQSWKRIVYTSNAAHCGNKIIFLPLIFYVISIFDQLRASKTALMTISEALNIDFWVNFSSNRMKKFSIFNIQMRKFCQYSHFRGLKLAKCDFT